MERRLLISGLLAIAAFAQIHAAVAQSNSPPFPHLGGYLIAGQVDPGTVANIGLLDVLIISGYEGYSSLATNVAHAKAANPNMKVTTYVILNGIQTYSTYAWEAINAYNWGLRSSYPSGGPETISGVDLVNYLQSRLSTSASPGPSGLTVRQWFAEYFAGKTGPGGLFASNSDGIYIDNFFSSPRTASGSGDWLETGTAVSNTSDPIPQDFRNAEADVATQLRTQMGSQYMVWVNSADWYSASLVQGFSGVVNGGVFEEAMNLSWSNMMAAYATQMNAMVPFNGGGPYLIFEGMYGGSQPNNNYQYMRYGLTSCLLDNGYYYWDADGKTVVWFDEYGVNLGAAIAGPNNPTNGTYSSGGLTVWQKGVYRRDFQNGIALVNPRGNGTQAVTLETTYKHFSGTQDPSVNNGQSVTSVTLSDGDGVILLRTTPAQQQPIPDAPALTVQ